jgi:HSP20 family molecular chaperone IbpA
MISDFETMAKEKKFKGEWKIDEINEDGVKGYRVFGRFDSGQSPRPFDPIAPFEPKNPLRPLPRPQRPFARMPKRALKESAEALADVFEDDKAIKVYFEVRGASPKDIELNVTSDKVEVKTKNFYKTISLPQCHIDLEKASSNCKNGVLVVEIPKLKKPPKKKVTKIDID